MDFAYIITPFLTWLVTGCVKFLVSSLRAGRVATDLIGYGGMPSNHSAIVSAMTVLVGLDAGMASPAFGVALTLAFIVMMDALSLRRHIGRQAAEINRLRGDSEEGTPLRERIGHTRAETLVGILAGGLIALLVHTMFG